MRRLGPRRRHPMSEEERTPRIVVRDRRAFAADGSRRPDAEPRNETPATPPAPGAESGRSNGFPSEATPAAAEPGATAKEDPRFRQLISLLFSQAAMILEQVSVEPTAAGGKPAAAPGPERAEALQGLQTVIGLVEVLEEKTRGRLAPGDERLVSQALYQLRIAYMERSQAPGA